MGNYIKAIPNYFDMTLDIPPALEEIIKYDRGNTVVHSKGPAVIFALDSVLGSEVFGRIYKKALSVFGGRCLGWRDFQELCESETGQNLEWFFNAWVRTNEHLCYTIESQDSQPEGQEFKTEIRVKRLGTMKMPVPVKAIFEDGTEQILQTDRTQDVNVLIFRSKAKLKEAIINPEKKLAMLEKPLLRSQRKLPSFSLMAGILRTVSKFLKQSRMKSFFRRISGIYWGGSFMRTTI